MKYLPQIVGTLQVTQPELDLHVLTSHGVDVVLVDGAQSGVLGNLAVRLGVIINYRWRHVVKPIVVQSISLLLCT